MAALRTIMSTSAFRIRQNENANLETNMNKYLVELIGTFFLVLTIGCTVIGHGAGPFAPMAIGSALIVMIFAGGHISGGHFNPAVTLGVWLRGKCEPTDVAPYMIFQVIGAVLAAFVVKFLKGGAPVAPLRPATGPALVAEFLFTFALVYGQFFLWAGDRIHGNGGGVFSWQHFRWSVQPSSRRGYLGSRAFILGKYLDLFAS
jgi:glycerol uptake facilitator-like aquaporin